MLTAHQKGACVVAVFTKDVAETKATEATDAGREAGHARTDDDRVVGHVVADQHEYKHEHE